MIDKYSPLPIYYQIEEAIKGRIEKGELQEGEMIPSEREYAETYGISRMTVRQAITNLVNDGYLTRRKGKGTFVANKKIEQKLVGLTSFTEDMKARGLSPSIKLLDFKLSEAHGKTATGLGIQAEAAVYEIQRVRLADQIPMALETTFLSADLVRGLNEKIVQGSLYQYVEEELGLSIDYATQELEASVAREAESEILGIAKGSPVLFIRRYTYLTDGRPLELVQSIYRGDRYKFIIDMQRG
ncbi:GntR family transcriptional regulator [Bacillus sp. OV194]|nr:GntR family transcriptional regulator [Bacillus sp. OV194]